MLPSGILGKHQSVSGRIIFGCLFNNPGSMIQYVCLEGVLMICSSHSLSECIYYVHSTKLASQLVKPGPYLHYIPLISASRLGTRHKKDMVRIHNIKNPYF